jgi:hypothetical protein
LEDILSVLLFIAFHEVKKKNEEIDINKSDKKGPDTNKNGKR